MLVEIKLDFLGENLDNAVFVQWLKKAGENVTKGDIICEVETYKAVFQIEAPESGILTNLKYTPGDVITIPAVLGCIQTCE